MMLIFSSPYLRDCPHYQIDVMWSALACIAVLSLRMFLAGKQGQSSQILYTKRAALSSQASVSLSPTSSASSSSSLPQGSPDSRPPPSRPAPLPSSPSQSQAAARAREFAADLFRRAQGGAGKEKEGQVERRTANTGEKEAPQTPADKASNIETRREEQDCRERREEERRTSLPQASTSGGNHSLPPSSEQVMSPASSSSSSSPSSPSTPSSSQDVGPSEPGYVNYSCLHYRLQQPGAAEQNTGGAAGGRKRDRQEI